MCAFPATPLPTTIELQLAGTWVDITSYVYTRDPIRISRGRADESSRAEPSKCAFTVNNFDGRFSPRKATGPYYGTIGRNTPVRVSVTQGLTRLVTPAVADKISTPDSANLSIVGDIDLAVDARLSTWAPRTSVTLLNKNGTAGQYSYDLGVLSTGAMYLRWSADGTAQITLSSTVALPLQTGRQAIRATLDVDNGAAGKTATFYSAPTIAGPWVQLGAPVTTAGTTSIFDNLTAVGIYGGANGQVNSAEIRQGIVGTVRANPNFTTQTSGATSFADAAGNTWTVAGGATLSNRRQRFIGEVSSWPSRWGVDEKDVWATVEAAGILRRLGQGATPLQSALRRGVGT